MYKIIQLNKEKVLHLLPYRLHGLTEWTLNLRIRDLDSSPDSFNFELCDGNVFNLYSWLIYKVRQYLSHSVICNINWTSVCKVSGIVPDIQKVPTTYFVLFWCSIWPKPQPSVKPRIQIKKEMQDWLEHWIQIFFVIVPSYVLILILGRIKVFLRKENILRTFKADLSINVGNISSINMICSYF